MKRFLAAWLLILVLTGCSRTFSEVDRAVAMRQRILGAGGCTFDAVITADYSGAFQTFSVRCEMDADGMLSFSVIAPETISGICGMVSAAGGNLTYEDMLLAFPMLADGQIAPACAPWLMMNTLRTGYIRACGEVADGLRISIDDSFRSEPLQMELWTDQRDNPVRAEFIWNGRRILSVDVKNFALL